MKVIAIDLDGTALEHPEQVNRLYDNKENLIVIYTARPEYLREKTESQLRQKGIKYHTLVMEKLRADIYVDDKNQGGLQWPES